jgi:hypothetical protein
VQYRMRDEAAQATFKIADLEKQIEPLKQDLGFGKRCLSIDGRCDSLRATGARHQGPMSLRTNATDDLLPSGPLSRTIEKKCWSSRSATIDTHTCTFQMARKQRASDWLFNFAWHCPLKVLSSCSKIT